MSQLHIDHILIMVYLAESYGVETARSAGQYNESFLLGFWYEGSGFEGSSEAGHNADLTFNELALCISQKMKHADANGGTTDRLTRQEVCTCVKAFGADKRKAIAMKDSKGASNTGYHDCRPCEKEVSKPQGLTLPPLDL